MYMVRMQLEIAADELLGIRTLNGILQKCEGLQPKQLVLWLSNNSPRERPCRVTGSGEHKGL